MAINPLSAALAAIQLGAGLSGIRSRMRDRSGQDRIQKLLQQAQARNLRGAQQIAASGEGVNPALAQRAALGYLTEANQEAARSAMAQEAAMAERDRARTDRLTGGALGALGSFGAQLLAGQDTSKPSGKPSEGVGSVQTPSLDALEATLDQEAADGLDVSPIMSAQIAAANKPSTQDDKPPPAPIWGTTPAAPGAMPDEDKPPTAPTWGTAPAAAPAAPAEQATPAAAAAPAAQTARPATRRRPRSRVQVGPVEVVPPGSPNVEVGPIQMVPPGSPNVEVGPIQVERPGQTTPQRVLNPQTQRLRTVPSDLRGTTATERRSRASLSNVAAQTVPASAALAQQPTMSMPRPMMSMPRSAPTTAAEALMSMLPSNREETVIHYDDLPPHLLRPQFRMGILPRGPFRRGRAPRMSILPRPNMSIGPR